MDDATASVRLLGSPCPHGQVLLCILTILDLRLHHCDRYRIARRPAALRGSLPLLRAKRVFRSGRRHARPLTDGRTFHCLVSHVPLPRDRPALRPARALFAQASTVADGSSATARRVPQGGILSHGACSATHRSHGGAVQEWLLQGMSVAGGAWGVAGQRHLRTGWAGAHAFGATSPGGRHQVC